MIGFCGSSLSGFRWMFSYLYSYIHMYIIYIYKYNIDLYTMQAYVYIYLSFYQSLDIFSSSYKDSNLIMGLLFSWLPPTLKKSQQEIFMGVVLLSFCQRDATYSHLEGEHLNWEGTLTRSSCGKVYRTFSWLMAGVGKPAYCGHSFSWEGHNYP